MTMPRQPRGPAREAQIRYDDIDFGCSANVNVLKAMNSMRNDLGKRSQGLIEGCVDLEKLWGIRCRCTQA